MFVTMKNGTLTIQNVAVEPDAVNPGQYDLFVGGTSGDDDIEIEAEHHAAVIEVNIRTEGQNGRGAFTFSGDFDASIIRAIQVLQDTPNVTTDSDLIRRPGYYEHTDAALRGLPPVQKQFLLIGPDNRQRILAWLKRLASALDLKI